MCLLSGRRLCQWFRGSSGRERAPDTTPLPSVSTAPSQEKWQTEPQKEEEQFDVADKSDSQLLELTENGLKSLYRKFELVILAKNNDPFYYWEFPLWFSQSRLQGRDKPSNACTLITMTIAGAFYGDRSLSDALRLGQPREGVTRGEQIAMLWASGDERKGREGETLQHKVCPIEIVRLMRDAIVRGNRIYDEERERGKYSVMYSGKGEPLKDIITIPDAIMARNRFVMGGSGEVNAVKDRSMMSEVDYIRVEGSVGDRLEKYVKYAIRHPSLSEWQIFCFIVISSEKAVSLVYRRDTQLFSLLDSHAHDNNATGSIVAVSNRQNFREMAVWMEKRIFPDPKNTKPKKFELSLLQWKNRKAISPINPNDRIRTRIYHGLASIDSPSSAIPLPPSPASESGYESDEVPTN